MRVRERETDMLMLSNTLDPPSLFSNVYHQMMYSAPWKHVFLRSPESCVRVYIAHSTIAIQ